MHPAFRHIGDLANRISYSFVQSLLPSPHYLPGETVQQTIQMAGYRASVPKWLGIIGISVLIPAAAVFFIARIVGAASGQTISGGFIIVGILLLFKAAQDWLVYHQWKFIVTDKRFILITPDPDRKGFADAIYLKGGKIQVLDTNLSKSPLWGFFQLTRGTRDVMLSMSGYEFKETGAQVKGGLRFPDVQPDDIMRLEELIFG